MRHHAEPVGARRFLRTTFVAAAVVASVAGLGPLEFVPPIANAAAGSPVRRVNVPYLSAVPFAPAIFWLGRAEMTSNYADVRVWYFDGSIHFALHITDRLLWHASSPSQSDLTTWDAVSLCLDVGGNAGSSPRPTSYRFVKQLNNDGNQNSKAAFRGTGSTWIPAAVSFTASSGWRGNYPNDTVWDMGWEADIEIPFSSLGLSGPPPEGTIWGLSAAVHDRDDAAGTPIADQVWPEAMEKLRPETWGQLHFGRPVYTPPTAVVEGTAVVRQGLNGALVPDAAVGGHTVCGEGMDAWTEWGNANYAGYTQFNIQNQWDIADFMCFSKYFVTFPLSAVPPGKRIVSARVTLHLFGNAGYVPGDAKPSAINALTVNEDWNEPTVTWNNAPYAAENTSVTWVYPVDETHPAGPYEWDVGYAAAQAYANGQPLRLAFYSTDGDYHSGKYFWTSDSDDWGGTVRPTLEVQWAAAAGPAAPTKVLIKRP